MYTQCPECLTIYEIDEHALRASLGIVHCGRCSKRFDALRSLSDTLPAAPRAPLQELDPGERVPTLTAPVPRSWLEPLPPPAAVAQMTASMSDAEGGMLQQDVEDWFADLESELATLPDTEASRTPAPGAADPGTRPFDAADQIVSDDVAAPEWDLDSDAPEPGPAVETWECDTGTTVPAPEVAPAAAGAGPEPAVSDAETAAPSPRLLADETRQSGDGEAAEQPPRVGPESDVATEAAPVYIRPRRPAVSRAVLAWAAGCVVLALTLAAQLAWANRIELFRNPATRPWVARVCRSVPCRILPLKDTAQLELLSRDIRPDPDAPGALTITATVRNNAGFRQPWPIVVVELTDLDNRPVAMRRFRPAEYMPDPARRAAGIAPGATAAVAFEVADPGKRAVSFQFGFD